MTAKTLRPWIGTLAGVLLLALVITFGIGHASGTVSITINPVSASTLSMGSAFVWTTTITNDTTNTLNLGNMAALTYPNGTQLPLMLSGSYTLLAPGKSVTSTANAVTTSPFTTATGTFTLQAMALDTKGTVWASTQTPFTITALPASIIPPRFTDLASFAGVGATHHPDFPDCNGQLNEGTGAGWADYDGDGYLDLFVSDYNGASHLYHNNGNLTFTETTAAAGIPTITHATGVTWADYDNDGHPDLLVLTTGQPYLFHNNGNGTFSDVTAQAGLLGAAGRETSAAWGDYNSDGFVDLYIVNYAQCNANGSFVAQPDHLFKNNGNGTFTDVTSLLGGVTAKAVLGHGFAAQWFDFNNDNRPDLYVVNDQNLDPNHTGNVLWRNDGQTTKGWHFTNVSAGSGANAIVFGMGVSAGDINRDGWMDLAYSNMGPNGVLQNTGANTFNNVATTLGAQRFGIPMGSQDGMSVTWGLGYVDLNNDGWEDLFIVGGSITAGMAVPHAVLVNNINGHLTGSSTDGSFLDLTYASGAGTNPLAFNRTVAFADFDADGWMDAFVVPYQGAPQLYRNEGPTDGNTNKWLEVRLVGTASNRMGIGAKLTLSAGSDTQYRMITSGTSLGAGSMIPAHFGLAQHSQADTLTIRWPSGNVQVFSNVAANQRIVVTEGSSTLGNDPVPPRLPSP